jgi:capsular exopolysaccharide synthesis family protein
MTGPPEGAALDLRELTRILLRRRWLLVVPWAVAIVLGVAAAFLLPPVYFSSVTMQIERPQQLKSLGDMISAGALDQQVDVMRDQVQSQVFLRSVIQATGLKSDPRTRAWALRGRARQPGLSDDEAVEQRLVEYLRDNVSIQKGRGSLFQVVVADAAPERARRLADAVASGFVASSKAAQLEALRATQEFSSDQLLVYKHRLEESEQRLEGFRRANLTATLVNNQVSANNVGQARSLVSAAELEAGELRGRAASLRTQIGSGVDGARLDQVSSDAVRDLAVQMTSLERQLGSALLSDPQGGAGIRFQLAQRYAECEAALLTAAAQSFPSMPGDTRQLVVRYRMAQIELQALEARRAWLAGQVGQYESGVVLAPDREMEEQRLRTEVETNRALYNSFLQQLAAAQIAEAFQNAKVGGRFVVLNPATLPTRPGKPNRPALILLSVVLGGIVGVGTVFIAEHHDFSLKNAEEVEQVLGLPVLGAVPRAPELERLRRHRRQPGVQPVEGGLITLLKVESPLGLEFRRVYLKLARSPHRPLPPAMLVTSASRAEGKTTVAACLALTLAREAGQAVLLVDFDLRSPSLHRALGLPHSSRGLAQMLEQRSFEERLVRATAAPHLSFLPAGKSERPASAVITHESVEWFLHEARGRYPLVVVDSAPNLAVPDSLVLGRICDAVVFVVKAGQTVRKAAEYGVRLQREARDNLLGVLMNDASEILPYYYGYRYNYYGYATEAAAGDS